MTPVEIICALLIALGLLAIVTLIFPGFVLIGAALLWWAFDTGGATAWWLAGIGLAVLAVGFVVKFTVPHRRLKDAGVPGRSLLLGAVLGIVGFFVIPVVGLFVGFVGGIWLAEAARLGAADAWPSTKQALLATGLSVLIELASGLVATALFVVGLFLT